MNDVLHILNGDDTWQGFSQTGIGGDVMVWREVFSEGPLAQNINAEFWRMRAEWITEAFHAPAPDYQQKVLLELEKLNEPYDEINLWFEFDLHCQLNLLGVMQLLQRPADLNERAIYLICPASHPEVIEFRGLGQLNAEQLEDVFDSRLQLTNYDFILAADAWKLYVNGNLQALRQWMDSVEFWGSMHLLKPALQAHIKRKTINNQGLNYIEQVLLDAWKQGADTPAQLYQAFAQANAIYGMGDMELNIYIAQLHNKGLIRVP